MRTLGVIVLIALTALRAVADDEIASVERLLNEMAAAVRASDVGAYLSLVDDRDAAFYAEQTAWARDLKPNPVELFDIQLAGEVRERPMGALVAPVEMRWRMPGGARRSVEFDAEFRRSAGGVGPLLFAGTAWSAVSGEAGGRVNTAKVPQGREELGRLVVESLPGVREHVHAVFGIEIDHEQQVKVYPSMEHLQASIYLSYTDPLAGWNEPGEAIKLISIRRMGEAQLGRLLAHEYAHVAQFAFGDAAKNAPWWMLEGSAEFASRTLAGDDTNDEFVRDQMKRRNLMPWDRMARFEGGSEGVVPHAYFQGEHLVSFVDSTYGADARRGWVRLMAQGTSADEASRDALGVSFDQLDAAWRDSITASDRNAADG